MARIEVDGIGIAYELFGEGPLVAITPGGRFSKDTDGVRGLAEEVAKGGRTALIWDRANCGESDVCFEGNSESELNADLLGGLIKALGRGPAVLCGGSAGARVSLITAHRHPDQVSGLFLLWISGGPIGLATLVMHYSAESAFTARDGGMAAVAELPAWKEQVTRNPGNRDRFLAQDPKTFIDTMQRWGGAFFPLPDSPVPGITKAHFAGLPMPVTVLRSGASDFHHPRATSENVHKLIPHSVLDEPPWGDREWIERQYAVAQGGGLFGNWPKLAPQLLAFANKAAPL